MKKWPYWLTGGIVGVGIAVLATPLTAICGVTLGGLIGWWCWIWFYVPFIPILLLYPGMIGASSTPLTITIGVIVWFIAGALIGLIVTAIKSFRKNK